MDSCEIAKANIEFHTRLASKYREQPFFRPENLQRVRSLLSSIAAETGGGRLLDIGCGTGFIFDLGYDLFAELEGVDITPQMLNLITPRPNVRTRIASADALPFEKAEFDVVTMYSVLHHIPDLAGAFREARRVLRPGGVFYADESPSRHYLDTLPSLSAPPAPPSALAPEMERLANDARKFCELYGIPQEITRLAMVQNYYQGGLFEENLRELLAAAGFSEVSIRFRRFAGEDELRRHRGESAVSEVQSYLSSVLPLSRPLFKFFVLMAH